MVKEIEADAKQFQDARRTLIQAEKKRPWPRSRSSMNRHRGRLRQRLGARAGPRAQAGAFAFKAGDALYATFECRSVDQLIVFGSNGRVYSVAVASLPAGAATTSRSPR